MPGRSRSSISLPKRQKDGTKYSKRRAVVVTGLGLAFAGLLSLGHIAGGLAGFAEFYRHFFPPHIPPEQQRILALANQIRTHFDEAKTRLHRSDVADFSLAQAALTKLADLDRRNGHFFYFSGEIKRMYMHKRFENGCVKDYGRPPDPIDSYHDDFRRYLDFEHVLPDSEARDSGSLLPCLDRSNGYCTQRTAWINHLLANDYYRQALAEPDPVRQQSIYLMVKEAVAAARKYARPYGGYGFMDCIDTMTLERHVNDALEQTDLPRK